MVTSKELVCPIRDVLDGISKWSCLVLLALAERPMRFGEFRAEIDGISQSALAEALHRLRRDGYIARDVRYRLTALGESLIGPVKLLERWAIENAPEIAKRNHL
jgi:DNA-binding HxlR family transcriptional regulator